MPMKQSAASNQRAGLPEEPPVTAPTQTAAASGPRPRGNRQKFQVTDLLRNTSTQARGTDEMMNAKIIARDRIEPDPDQPRRSFTEETIEELATSIKEYGLITPISVRYDHARDVYIIVTGERRWRAAGIAGLAKMPAIVVENQPDDQRLIVQLMENIQREDLNDLDRADGLKRLKAAMNNAPWDQVADRVGIKRSRIYQLLDLLDPAKVTDQEREAIRRGTLSEKHIRSVLRHLSGPKREGLQRAMEEDRLSVQEATAAKDALLVNPHITDETPVEQVVEAIRQVRREVRNPRPPAEWMDERAAVASVSRLPVPDDASIAEAVDLARRLQALLVAFTDAAVSPMRAKQLRPAIRRLREAADLYLDQSP